MCGIFCALKLDSNFSSSDFSKFMNLTEKVAHRGPDSSGYLALNIQNQSEDTDSFNIFLGHRRLSIIDLSTSANQPMVENKSYMIYNGEIFNYLELREELIQKGIKFKTRSDSEVILKLYEYYTEDSFWKLNGMWAIIIIDLRRNKLVISRDRFSIKPLFFYRKGFEFYFASEIKQLIPLIPQKKIDEQNLVRFLNQGLSDLDETTFFSDIKRIKPKFNLAINLTTKHLTEKQYWDFSNEETGTEEEIINKFSQLLTDSIKIRLRSDVKVGVLLSGGLDSSSIALLAGTLNHSDLQTYSVISNEKKYSEENFIDEFNLATGIENHKLFFAKENVIDYLNEVLYYQDEPFVSFSIIAQYLIFKELKKQSDITVVLSGQGADEILLGYLRYFAFYIKDLQKDGKYYELLKLMLFVLFHRTFIRQFKLNIFKRYFRVKKYDKIIKIKYEPDTSWNNYSMEMRQKSDIDKYSIPILTRYEDRNSMSNSLEVRLPFLDHRLVNYMINLPANYKINKGWNKYLLRKSMVNLPHKIRWRKDKKGFITPDEKWLKRDLVDEIKCTFDKSILAEMGIIDKNEFIQYYNSYLKGDKFIHNFDISRFYITEKWLQQLYFAHD